MLSVAVPTFDSAPTLARCLDRVSEADELIVVDGGSSDATAAIAEAAGARLVEAPKGRGSQLRAGAEAARGDWLLFLHADTMLGSGWRAAVRAHVTGHPLQAACFRLRLDAAAWQARLVERGVALRVAIFGLPYGDQALLVPRSLYERVGGYSPLPLMEDVDLVRRIGRRRVRVLPEAAVTSAERWRRDGWLRRSARNLACLALFCSGMSAERVARLYG